MDFGLIPTTKPYLVRAIHEWCTDQGLTPYLGVAVDASVEVPMGYVSNGQIVLNVSYGATDGLKIDHDLITFKGRFNGQVKDIMVPIARVIAVYAKENGQGMAFEPTEAVFPDISVVEPKGPAARPAVVSLVTRDSGSSRDKLTASELEGVAPLQDTDEPPPPEPPRGGGLRRVK